MGRPVSTNFRSADDEQPYFAAILSIQVSGTLLRAWAELIAWVLFPKYVARATFDLLIRAVNLR